MLISIASMAIGEMFASPRIYQYVGGIAPKGQEGLYLGYVNLPWRSERSWGSPRGMMFEHFISKPHAAGQSVQAVTMWIIVSFMGYSPSEASICTTS